MIVPMRVAIDASVAPEDPDPRGMAVIGCDGKLAGTVTELWVDRAEPQIRYLEVAVAAAATGVLVPMTLARRHGDRRQVRSNSVTGAQFAEAPTLSEPGPDHQARGGQDRGLLRERAPLRHARTASGRSCERGAPSRSAGCPGRLPAGETAAVAGLARTGARWPAAPSMAGKVAIYFGLLLRVGARSRACADGATVGGRRMARAGGSVAAGRRRRSGWYPASWLGSTARTTVYTITNRRVVISYGIALPMSLNIPFRTISGAALSEHSRRHRRHPAGHGRRRTGSPICMLWPHARPMAAEAGRSRRCGRFRMLRGSPRILARALAAAADQPVRAVAARLLGR